MLSAEQAQRELEQRRQDAEAHASRGRLTAVFGKTAGALPSAVADTEAAVRRMEALGRRARRAAFAAVCPGLGGELAAVFEHAGGLTYPAGWERRPFRAPTRPGLARARVLDAARTTAPALVEYAADPTWLARWAGHLLPQSWSVSAQLVGWLLAAAVEDGNEAVFELLLASIDGTDEVATMGRHVPIALLTVKRPEAWERVEQLLLSAQREEGLRQSILEVVDEAHPQALRRMLALIHEHGLSRFASVARAVSVWFGLEVFAGDRRRVDAVTARALTFLDDPATTPDGPLDVYLALWAQATTDVLVAIETARTRLDADDPEVRFSAVAFLVQTHVDEAAAPLLRALDDADLRVAGTAVAGLPGLQLPESYDVFDRLLARLPKRTIALDPVAWFGPLPALKRDSVGELLLLHHDPPDVDRVLPHRKALDTWDRSRLVKLLAEGALTPARRAALLEALGDGSPQVREEAIRAAAKVTLSDAEALELEPLLRRKPGDLRRGVVELILARGEAWALAAAERLLAGEAQERLGGVELLRRLSAAGSDAATARLTELGETEDDQVVEQATKRAVADNALTALTEADAFGLCDAAGLTPVTPPRATGFELTTIAARRVLLRLDQLIDAHADVEIVIDSTWSMQDRVLLGAAEYADFASHLRRLRAGETELAIPLLEVWQRFAAELPADARDADELQFLRALLTCAKAWGEHQWSDHSRAAAAVGVRHFTVVQTVLDLLIALDAGPHVLAGALDAAETEFARLSKRQLREQPESPALQLAHTLAAAGAPPELMERFWRLERWLTEPPGVTFATHDANVCGGPKFIRHSDRVPNRRSVEMVVRAFEAGAATEDDLIDHLAGPRGPSWSFWDLGRVSSRRDAEQAGAGPKTHAVVDRIRERVIAIELARGEAPTAAAEPVLTLSHSGGLEVVVPALVALGRERFVRGWTNDGQSRAAVFSHMVATSHPGEGDTPERFAEAVRAAKLSDRVLRELACYSPQWAAHVEAALAVDGLADAVWWLHAHTKDDHWRVNADLRAGWERSVADRTDLTGEQLVDGAVDVRWFTEIRERLSDDELDALLKAAKYGSTAGGHKRAELFAQAMRGALDGDEVLQRIEAKRHQDSVRALGLLPLDDPDALARRYAALHAFRRGSREFGKQRQGSENRATEIAFENLARTAGFTDPARLTWAMEAAATADLAGEGAVVEHDDVRVALRVDPDGKPEVAVQRGAKALKHVPAKLRKVPEIQALTGRASELRRQSARIRTSLEQAMIRGDELTGDELATYREHALLWPALSRLLLVGDGTCGYPDGDGRVLRDHAGGQHAIGNTERLRIAHPLDLLERGDWPAWQQDVLARRLVQPFKQAFRELYLPVDSERTDDGASRRYAGHQVQPGRTRALLTGRGWRIDEYDGARRTDHHAHVAATLWFLDGFGSPADIEPPTLEEVRFTSTRDGRTLALDEVPGRLFSEIMRDLDLVVSVAHVAGVDPEASQSSLAMRAALVAETVALLSYENVTVDGPRALIDGEIGRYSVHLGSAGVHRLPGGAVCIVPVHAQHRGRVFLPFADDDPKTAEIVAKVLMLARDRDIRDPTILEQLRR